MNESNQATCTAFADAKRIASGPLTEVARTIKTLIGRDPQSPALIFDDVTGRPIDVDFRGSVEDVVARLETSVPAQRAPRLGDGDGGNGASPSPYRESVAPRARGRPRLGVVAREVTLLPRHWDWLATQPGGASAAVRRLVDEARQTYGAKDRRRQAQESAYRFMSAMAGNEPGFEEATRALFANDRPRFGELTARWPADVRDHARMLAERAFA
jgi:hypothetical protein